MIDKTDINILKILQQNAREKVKAIGKAVGLTSPAAAERIKKMEEKGVIKKYSVKINPAKLGLSVEAFICINVLPSHQKHFSAICDNSPWIISNYRVVGEHNAILHVFTTNNDELEKLIDDLKKTGSTQTSIVLSSPFREKIIEHI